MGPSSNTPAVMSTGVSVASLPSVAELVAYYTHVPPNIANTIAGGAILLIHVLYVVGRAIFRKYFPAEIKEQTNV